MDVSVRYLAAYTAYAAEIPIRGTLGAGMDGVSLCLEKNIGD